MIKAKWGVIPALVTPFDSETQRLNYGAIEHLCEHVIEAGVDGLFPMGTTGEGALMSLEERMSAAEVVISSASGRVPVIVHTGAATTEDTITLSQHARRHGAAAAAVVTPYYYSVSDEAMARHYEAVADAVPDLPILLYNIPSRTGNTLSFDTIARVLDSCQNVVGIKDSSGDFSRLQRLVQTFGDRLDVICGADDQDLVALVIGAQGLVSSVSGVFPEPFVAMKAALESGRLKEALALQAHINCVLKLLKYGADLSLFKLALGLRGLDAGTVRAPLIRADDASLIALRDGMADLGYL